MLDGHRNDVADDDAALGPQPAAGTKLECPGARCGSRGPETRGRPRVCSRPSPSTKNGSSASRAADDGASEIVGGSGGVEQIGGSADPERRERRERLVALERAERSRRVGQQSRTRSRSERASRTHTLCIDDSAEIYDPQSKRTVEHEIDRTSSRAISHSALSPRFCSRRWPRARRNARSSEDHKAARARERISK